MHPFNATLHKQALLRRKLIRGWLAAGRTYQSIGRELGISRQRVHQLAGLARAKPRHDRSH